MAEQKNPPHLKLVVSNPDPAQKKKPLPTRNSNMGFTAEIKEKGHPRYTLVACDPFHYLDCEVELEIHDSEDEEELEPKAVVCHFPDILADELNEFVEEDETLYGMILVQFQMKIMKEILLFCRDHHSLNLMLYANDTDEGHALGIYENLVAREGKHPAIYKIPTITGTKTQMVIPTTKKTFDKLIRLTGQANKDFRQALWEDQGTNPSIRWYLRSNPCLKFFG